MASQAAYCAAKAGMDHFTRCVALDEAIKPHGAKVCSLAPGVIDTDMQVQLRGADPAAFPPPEFRQPQDGWPAHLACRRRYPRARLAGARRLRHQPRGRCARCLSMICSSFHSCWRLSIKRWRPILPEVDLKGLSHDP